jgi:hypothetical protein
LVCERRLSGAELKLAGTGGNEGIAGLFSEL